ncbi:STAS domain-containing protein [Actinosynnema pretiosum subsp. pretiosum]|uniref:Anti-sigma factor antagonist n=3 Tax=Actinosynnema TaxID=40566 RepID=C6W854_ACTMD|nr:MULTISPECIES: STAS domain-containing protein [Actinosynnema]ACU37075.1 anti-sigma-factor antagonist [Actinosynnema mirum DSM 43827]ATE54622.1 anti-sigma factor antagonist [Actinosynnema pretiosum]AXX30560.1 Anti-sigma F factor antagonist (spoIIAA-2), Anti-sigma B factor antagonist RsbV [Actinosynnema pretiosum subsp. pretiosum]QUF05304.1 STAS domain-containing protein [Actinosynnema pretiosum subsp. pretiosum]
MTSPETHAITGEVVDGVAVVRASGEIDMANSDDLRVIATDLVDGGAQALVVDLSEVTFFASSGIAALAYLRDRVGRGLVRAVPSRSVRRSLEATAVDKLIPLHENLEEALTAAR